MDDFYNPMRQLNIIYENIKPSMAYVEGEDIKVWKKKAKKKLIELTGLDKFHKVLDNQFKQLSVEKIDNYKRIKYSLLTEEKFETRGYLLLPDDIENPPLMICLQGHSSGMHISLGEIKFSGDRFVEDRDFAIQAIKRGYSVMVIEQRHFGEVKRNPYLKKADCHVPTLYEFMLGRTTVAERVWDISRTLDSIIERYGINENNISIMGHSSGGTIAYYAACLEERITACIPSGNVCSYKSQGNTYRCICGYIPSIINYFEMSDLALLIAPRPIVIVVGKPDSITPFESAQETYREIKKLYAMSGAENNCRFVYGNRGHTFYVEPAWEAFDEIIMN